MTGLHKNLETEKDPLLCAISARVIIAIGRISDGRISEALSALEQIEKFLPKPSKHEMLCATAAADRGALMQRSKSKNPGGKPGLHEGKRK